MDPITNAPAAPAPTAPAVRPPAPATFGDAAADIVKQILPHFDRIKANAEAKARDAAYQYVQSGALDQALLKGAQALVARAEHYSAVITKLLADPMLPGELVQWWHTGVTKAA